MLVGTESRDALSILARSVSRRFDLAFVAIALPRGDDWDIFHAGASLALDHRELASALAAAQTTLEFDARARTYAGHRTMHSDGQTVRLVPLRVGTRPIGLLAAAGRPVEVGTLDALAGVVAIGIERAQLLEARKAGELARQSEELKTALLASLGHDLRTPLTAIRVAAANLQAPGLGEDDRRSRATSSRPRSSGSTACSRTSSTWPGSTPAAWPPSRDGRTRRKSCRRRATRWGRRCAITTSRVHVEPDIPIRLDPRLTASALAHLLENAAQYAPAGLTIDVTASSSPDELSVSVRYHGPGVSRRDLPHIFNRFFRGAESKGRTSGTGMGLWIARGLLAVQHGRVWAENLPDGGARFTHRRSRHRRQRRRHRRGTGVSDGARILLVDDEVSIQRAVAPLLRSRGYQVDLAGTGADALSRARELSPDLVVLDLGLPDIEGTEVCRRMRETSNVPIVVLSARGSETDKVQALDLGADDYVTKPFGPEELLARIRVALRRVAVDAERGPVGRAPAGRPRHRLRPPPGDPARTRRSGSRPRSSSCCRCWPAITTGC